MAIAFALETREQTYEIYGGSAGLSKIIGAVGLVDTPEMTTGKILEILADLERRKAIVSILLEECEFVPEVDVSTKPKKDSFIAKTAKQLDTGWIFGLISELAQELNTASTTLKSISPKESDFVMQESFTIAEGE